MEAKMRVIAQLVGVFLIAGLAIPAQAETSVTTTRVKTVQNICTGAATSCSVYCPDNSIVLGGGCQSSDLVNVSISGTAPLTLPPPNSGWNCTFSVNPPGNIIFTAYAICYTPESSE
jgi:hypothetical protein